MTDSTKFIIEVCVDSVESAIAAVRGGADRLELCGNLGIGGGTTPSLGLLKAVEKAVPNIPIMAMVRPRAGDFVYSEDELNVMLEDISIFKEYGIQGVVFGVLTPSGEIDHNRIRQLVRAAAPLETTFHRAFDMVVDPKNAWDTLCKVPGITRVLTRQAHSLKGGGHCKHASYPEALDNLSWMLDSSMIGVLPGSGIKMSTVPLLCDALIPHGLKEIHLSGGRWLDGGSEYRREGMGMGVGGAGEWGVWRTEEEAVRKVREFVERVRVTCRV